jgi:hypothetical protein
MKIEQTKKDLLKLLAEMVKEDTPEKEKVLKVVDPFKPKRVVAIRTPEQKEATKKKRLANAAAKKLQKLKENNGKSLETRWNETVRNLSIK